MFARFERDDDRARHAPPAPSTIASLEPFVPAGRRLVEIAEEAEIIGVRAAHMRVADHQSVDRADRLGERVEFVDERVDSFLVRDGDVAAGKLAGLQPLEKRAEIMRLDVDRLVAAVDAVLLQPEIVDQRRARMGDRVPDDEGAFHVNRFREATTSTTGGLDTTRRLLLESGPAIPRAVAIRVAA